MDMVPKCYQWQCRRGKVYMAAGVGNAKLAGAAGEGAVQRGAHPNV
jgi:hypothetical protein